MDDDELVSVDGAAEILDTSVATVRRMCASGQIEAIKAGRAWLIPLAGLRRLKALAQDADLDSLVSLDSAFEHVKSWDLKREVWVPDALGFADELAAKDALFDEVRQKLTGKRAFDPARRTAFPKSPVLFRNASDLSLSDRIAFEAVVGAMGPILDGNLSSAVFNNRWDERSLRRSKVTLPWERFTEATKDEVLGRNAWLVTSDVAAFFDFINHRILLDRISALGVSEKLVAALSSMLSTWALRPGAGLPQGPDASRLLANFYLSELDEAVQDHRGIQYFRFMDDIRIVAESRTDATRALSAFARELDRLGLPISSAKTVAFDPDAAAEFLVGDDLRGADYDALDYEVEVGLLLGTVDEADVAEERLKSIFFDAVKERGQLKRREATFSLYRLLDTEDPEITAKVIARLEDLSPIASLVLRYLSNRLDDPRVAEQVFAYIDDPNQNTSEFLEHWLLAGLIDADVDLSPASFRTLRIRFADLNLSASLRGTIASLLVRSGRDADTRLIEDQLATTEDARYARQLLVALRRAKRLTTRTRQRISLRFPQLEGTIKFLNERQELPRMTTRPPGSDDLDDERDDVALLEDE